MKSYTDILQSKKLADILPLESADMRYAPFGDTHPWVWDEEVKLLEKDSIPCWSLAAIINVINTNYYTTLYHDGVAWNIDIIHHDNVKEKHSVYANTPIDACYEMVLKLKNLNLL